MEKSNLIFSGRVTNEEAFDCMIGAMDTGTGISVLFAAWNTGATVSTILSVLKNILKISSGWFAVGYGVHKLGECVNWW